ncbi:flavodoxin family protein [Anaerostipes sp.]|uniref:flavodoxin family protein n=1 Tax=Anaerostipes sp. TaxID=1872530 RepID=UPI0025BA94C6|nr:flavodoxin family protein [Anaerostipes sp.]MBS7006829.1 flavodoxin family protein [Anaerostipes sp.]
MKVVIHDLNEKELEHFDFGPSEKVTLVGKEGRIRNCTGCFGCWIKTPGRCVIRDRYGDMGELISRCSEIEVISECCYGGYSPFVKNVLDRSIPYLHPYFVIKNNEMHHKQRYKKTLKMTVRFYGAQLTEEEKNIAEELVKANAVNLYADVESIQFGETPYQLGGR